MSPDQTRPSPEPFNFQTYSSPDEPGPSSYQSPDAAQLNQDDLNLHGFNPLEYPLPVVRCDDCQRPILQSAILNHAANCERVRTLEQAALEDDGRSLLSVGLSSNKRRLSNASMSDVSSPPPHPKRTKLATEPPSPAPSRASLAATRVGSDTGGGGHSSSALEIEARKAIDKKLLKEAQRAEKKGERNQPLDLGRHCGVINQKGVPCPRALTCKSHPVGHKRDVVGRPKPFDVLLAEWNAIHKPHLAEKAQAVKLRREREQGGDPSAASASETATTNGLRAGERKKGGGGSGGKKNRRLMMESGTTAGQLSQSTTMTPVSELASLIAAAQASRARIASTPSRRLTAVLTHPSTGSSSADTVRPTDALPPPPPPPSAIPASLLGGGPPRKTALARSPANVHQRAFAREAGKGLLYGRRRTEVVSLNGLLREALTSSDATAR